MFQHLRYKSAQIEIRTQAGRCADEKLDLNDPRTVEYREFILRLINKLVREKEAVERALNETQKKILLDPSRPEYLILRNESQELLAEINSDLNRIFACPDPVINTSLSP
jgi:hypothetical protein